MEFFTTFCQLLMLWRGFEMQLLSLTNFKHGMYKDRINTTVYWVDISKNRSGMAGGALCLCIK